MKKKLMFICVCILVLLIIFVRNIYIRVNNDKNQKYKKEIITREGSMIPMEEALRMLGYLGADRDKLNKAVNYSEETTDTNSDQSDSYDTNYLTFKDYSSLLLVICKELDLKSDAITEGISFDLSNDNKAVLIKEFLELYENMIKEMPSDHCPVTFKTMYVIGQKSVEEDTDKKQEIMITDQGDLIYSNTANYADINTNEKQDTTFDLNIYIDNKITGLVYQNELVYVKEIKKEDTVLHNVWITEGYNDNITAFLCDTSKNFTAKYKISDKIEGKVADLTIRDKKVIKISLKPDIINGKVLVANKKYMEIKGYGKVQLDDNYKIYKIYGDLSSEVTNSILVGYDSTDFVVADGKIVAALIKEEIDAKNIRVLIKTNGYESIFHKEVKLTANRDFTITIGDSKKKYKKGEEVKFALDDTKLQSDRAIIKTSSENGKIKLLSVNRSYGNPSYRGTLEVSLTEDGLVVINELSIEEYLYAVIPSEMPTSYDMEALKAQAICARSYAYKQLFSNDYSEYGAHIDDSSAYQVYNNIAEDENSILAVKDTYGKVVEYNKKVINAYYFSTSCGHTASLDEVWSDSSNVDYLVGKLQYIESSKEDTKEEEVAASSQNSMDADLSSEKAFKKFMTDTAETTYDSNFAWYRWNVTVSLNDLGNAINNNISKRYEINPELILTLVGEDKYESSQYESKPIQSIGNLKEVLISKREKSGILSELILVGSACTIKVKTEYNIRCLLSPGDNEITRKDGSKITSQSMLPSAYFYMDKSTKKITFHGGGYGHGVGMSQNGAKAMADLGITYDNIIKHYYNGVELGYIY